jgi:hypothetical protein
MARIGLAMLVLPALLSAAHDRQPKLNVNSRYTVEAVEVAGVEEAKLSKALREDLHKMIGEKFDQQAVERLLARLRSEFPGRSVSHKLHRGLKPEHVKLVITVWRHHLDVNGTVNQALYHSKQGWSGALEVSPYSSHNNRFSFGILSNADDLLERFAGLTAGYERKALGSDKVRLKFQFESFHQIWNRTTLIELARSPEVPGIYRTRQNFQPTLSVLPARGLTLSLGTSFQRFQTQFPAARTEAANALVTTLRYDRQLEDSVANRHRLEAGYNLRAATRTLSSDFVYARHAFDFNYKLSRGRHRLENRFAAGVMTGRAPLFERFTLGNSYTLRGWNKFDVAPLGGNRVVHNALEYRYRPLKVFYDAGAVWSRGQDPAPKHSLGVGVGHHGFMIALAFPIKDGRAEPVFMAGMIF